MFWKTHCCWLFLTILAGLSCCDAARSDELTFEKDVRPIFRAHCFDCHGATEEKEGGLDLRQVRLLVKGGESGSALVKGDSGKSLLVERIVAGEMPPGDHPVPAKDLEIIKKWISSGAKTARPEPEVIPRGLGITSEERSYWAFQPIRRPDVPLAKSVDRVKTPIDSFLLAKMETKGLAFAADAAKTKLIRRAYLDLIGLPPSPQQIENFLADNSDQAWEKVIDELLASKHYGERWGRHWLDVAGYADSEGANNSDDLRPWAYKYRDWVIQSFNKDMPFDQFITWQLAGDELIDPPFKNFSPSDLEKLTATGFLRMTMDGTARANNEENRNAVVRDMIDVVSSSLLGLSVKCAQCHDHRYDPISQEDYFRLRAVFEPAFDVKNWRVPGARLVSLYTDADHAKAQEIEKQAQAKLAERNKKQAEYMKLALETVLAGVEEKSREPLRNAYQTPANKRTPEQNSLLKKFPSVGAFSPGVLYQYNQAHADELKKMDAEVAAIRANKPVHEYVRSVAEVKSPKVPKTMLFHRGDYRQPKYEVKPGGLTVCSSEDSPFSINENDPSHPTTGRRLAYARWLTSGRHPLVARVLVNRIWLFHFGKTFVSTAEDFGRLGTLPTHPELLDWLADEFMAKGWSLKHLHRLILRSTVYRQASIRTAEFNRLDQNNDLYWHFPVHRLEAETVRDAVLSVSGKLDIETQFGKPVDFKADDTGQNVVEGEKQRRSVYLQVRRSQPISILESFDAPAMKVNCTSRIATTSATQSLMLMNSKFATDSAKSFAGRINVEAATLRSNRGLKSDIDQVAQQLETNDPWSLGYGSIDRKNKGAVTFSPYPTFAGGMWKGSDMLPDPKIGWSFVNSGSGHPDFNNGATIRRWTSPVKGLIRVAGSLGHGQETGDGVELTLTSNKTGIVKSVVAHHANKNYSAEINVTPGEIIDTVVEARANHTSDTYSNSFRLELVVNGKVEKTWDSAKDFQGPNASKYLRSAVSDQIVLAWLLAYGRKPTDKEFEFTVQFLKQQFDLLKKRNTKQPVGQAMTNLCQMLLSSNEFLYVD